MNIIIIIIIIYCRNINFIVVKSFCLTSERYQFLAGNLCTITSMAYRFINSIWKCIYKKRDESLSLTRCLHVTLHARAECIGIGLWCAWVTYISLHHLMCTQAKKPHTCIDHLTEFEIRHRNNTLLSHPVWTTQDWAIKL